MRLWVDGQCLQTASRLRGIGRYVTDLLRAIAENHSEVELSISFNAAMPEEALLAREAVSDFIDRKNIHVWHGLATGGEAVEGYTPERKLSELAIVHHVNCLAPDVALSTSPFEGVGDSATPLLPAESCDIPVASIFYDAIPYRYQDRYLDNDFLHEYYHRRLNSHNEFSYNLCISDFSKSELKSIFNLQNSDNIDAGTSDGFASILQQNLPTGNIHGEYILYVGGYDWRKNVSIFPDTFRLIDRALNKNHLNLVMAGDGPQVLVDEFKAHWNRAGLDEKRLIHLGHVSNEELVALYRQAKVLVQPSFMEGFGLTALEAIQCGTPVAAARAGALPEVVGVEALLFDPSAPEDLARILQQLLGDRKTAARLTKKAQAHASRFTWKRSADIAVRRLAAIAPHTAAFDLRTRRRRSVRALNGIGVEQEAAAHVFSLSEPASTLPRLLVDVTSTARVDHKTGIQRVVNNISSSLVASDKFKEHKRMLAYCDDENGWYSVDNLENRNFRKRRENKIAVRGDTLLMLDSSWEFHDVHRHYLRSCRLFGGDVISCLYDTVPLRTSAFCDPGMPIIFSAWLQSALAYSTGFVCISRAVADELYAMLDAISFPRSMKIGYWHLGADFIDTKAINAGRLDTVAKERPFFLMVGTLEPRKGHRVALEAFEQLWASGVEADLVIVGKEGWGVEALGEKIRSHREYNRRLFWHAKADDATLASLYERCDALIAASFGEGFGLPLVEAGYFGKPVIASDIPVFREVGEGAASARFFEVGSAGALARAVEDHLGEFDKSPQRESRASWQNWRESAAQLEDVVLGENWYKIYQPRERRDYAPLDDLGQVMMRAPLPPEERAHAIRHIEGPDPIEDGRALKITVAVSNLSGSVWSSRGAADGSLGVNLSHHILDRDGRMLQYDNPRNSIPFVHIPGDTIYMPVTLPADWKERGAAFVDVELVQEGVAWFGGALRIAL